MDGDAAVEHLREAHALIDDPIRRAETANLLGRQLFLLRGEEADAVFTQALVELAGADAELERLLEAGLNISTIFVPSLHRAALERLARVRNRPADATFGEKLLLAQVAYHDARAGTPAAVAVPLARRALAKGTLVREDVDSAAFVLAPPCSRWPISTKLWRSTRTRSPRRTGAGRASPSRSRKSFARRPLSSEATWPRRRPRDARRWPPAKRGGRPLAS